MNPIVEYISQPWPWYVAGPMIAFIMFLLFYSGKTFGVSSTLRAVCSLGGAAKFSDYFQFDWKSQAWNLVFVVGALFGGFIASTYLMTSTSIDLNTETIEKLDAFGISAPQYYLPLSIFNWDNLLTTQGLIIMILGGFLVGFGARWAGGCTSGHAITGLSNFQLPSFIAVIGFFIGGLVTTHFLLPYILTL